MKFSQWLRSFGQCFTAGVTAATLFYIAAFYLRPEAMSVRKLFCLVAVVLVVSVFTPLIVGAKQLMPSAWVRRLVWAFVHASLSVVVIGLFGFVSMQTVLWLFVRIFIGTVLLAMPTFFFIDLAERRRIAQINAGLEKMSGGKK
ncbi:MAG: hypothetical protein E7654_03415 [Ruminococcaceae bacterium]|nr:hypothetical protein [Oscillospiraceae bacterium]